MYEECTVLRNEVLCNGYKRMTIEAGSIALSAKPGQFVMLKCWEGNDPFFMRPFSINSANAQAELIDILYKVRGRGTALMAQKERLDRVRVMGPLGKGFSLDPTHRRIALLGRGVGAAPLRFLAEQASGLGMETYVFLSAAQEAYLFDKDVYLALGAKVYCSCAPDEVITDRLAELMQRMAFDAAYCCGSSRVMRGLAEIHRRTGLPCYVSLEEHMGCGVGACKSCNCKTVDDGGNKTEVCVCKEGPVFPVERICV